MANGFFKYFAELPPLAKTIITIFIILLAIILFIWGRKLIKQWNREKGYREEIKDVTTSINNLISQGIKQSYTSGQYATWANQFQEAFDGCGTSNDVWRDVFSKMKNELDVLLLIDAYGTRTFDECDWEFNFGDFTGTLGMSLVHELSSSEKAELNKLLTDKGINYTF